MSIYNSANELAWRIVYGEHYFNEPGCQCGACGRPKGITVRDGKLVGVLDEEFYGEPICIDLTGRLAEDHQTWANLAMELQYS
jgi:hypothetical protein